MCTYVNNAAAIGDGKSLVRFIFAPHARLEIAKSVDRLARQATSQTSSREMPLSKLAVPISHSGGSAQLFR